MNKIDTTPATTQHTTKKESQAQFLEGLLDLAKHKPDLFDVVAPVLDAALLGFKVQSMAIHNARGMLAAMANMKPGLTAAQLLDLLDRNDAEIRRIIHNAAGDTLAGRR